MRPSVSTPTVMIEESDTTIAGRYAIQMRLGAGASGVVYRATDRDTGAQVALKTLRMETPEQVSLLRNEFRVVQGLQHPNLVQVMDIFGAEGRLWLSMEFVSGTDFLAYVTDANGAFIESKLRAALRQLASALAALHAAKIVHRDLKPSNVLVADGGRVVVLDFGLATSLAAIHPRKETGGGTALYMAPEQVGAEGVGPAADWYSFGVMVFRALTGVCPFEGDANTVLARKLGEPAPSPNDLVSGLPSDLATLCEELLRADPKDRPSESELVRRLGAQSGTLRAYPQVPNMRQVGREAEMAWLYDAFVASRGGNATVAVVEGESGIGKSVLLGAFVSRLRSENPNVLVLRSRCYEREFVPFKAFEGVASELVDVLAAAEESELATWLTPDAGLLPRLFPELGAVPALAELASAVHAEDPLLARRLGFEAFRELLRGLSRSCPLVLAIDDLQWADADSLALLTAIFDAPNAPPLLLVATTRVRGAAQGHSPSDTVGLVGGDVRTLRLEKLATLDAVTFVAALLHQASLPRPSDAAVLALVRESEGHPMFLAELVLQSKDGKGGGTHRRLEDALSARIARLDPAAQRLLEAVCVAGVRIDQRVAAGAASVDRTELARLIPVLHAERVIQTTPSVQSTIIEPYHDRIREAVVSGLGEEQVRSWHAKLALSWEIVGAQVEPEVLAQHWLKSGAADRAKSYLLRGAEKANLAFAFERAASCFEQAIGLSTAPAETKGLRLDLALALTNAKRWREAAELRLDLAHDADAVESLHLRTVAAEQLLCSGRFDKGAAILLDVLRAFAVFVPRAPWSALLALVVARTALAIRGVRVRTEVRTLAPRRAAAIDGLIAASFGFSMSDTILGSYFSTRALLEALSAHEPTRLARTLFSEALHVASRGAPTSKKTLRLIDDLRAVVDMAPGPEGRALLTGAAGYHHYFRLDWARAKADLLLSAQVFNDECVGQFWATNTMRTLGFRAMTYLGEAQELRECLPLALSETERVGDLYGITNLRSGPLAWLRLVQDDVTDAERELGEVAALLPSDRFVVQSYFYLIARVQFELYRGEAETAHRLVEDHWGRLRGSLLLRVSALRVAAWDLRGRSALASAHRCSRHGQEERLRLVAESAGVLAREPYACAQGQGALLRSGFYALRARALEAAREALRAEQYFDQVSMKFHSAASLWLRGAILGGTDGEAWTAKGEAVLLGEGVAKPHSLARLMAPALLMKR